MEQPSESTKAVGKRAPFRWPFQLGKTALGLAGFTALLFLTLPLIVLAARGAASRVWGMGVPQAVYLSLVTTGISMGIVILFGTPLAYIFARWHFPFKHLLNVLIELPIVLPPVVAGLALLLTTGRNGLLGPALNLVGLSVPFTTAAVVVAQVFVSAPFYIRSAQVGFQNVPREIEDAALVDGAAGSTLFRYITLPLTASALAAGLTLSWARALGEFGATIMLAGSLSGRTQTMPLLIYNLFAQGDTGALDAAIWTSLLLLGLALLALLASQWLARRSIPQETARSI